MGPAPVSSCFRFGGLFKANEEQLKSVPGSLPNTAFGSLPNTAISGHFQTPFKGHLETQPLRVLGAGARVPGV